MTPSPIPNAAIPKSMSEIYVISNRNRRKKKGGEGGDDAEGGDPDVSMESQGTEESAESGGGKEVSPN